MEKMENEKLGCTTTENYLDSLVITDKNIKKLVEVPPCERNRCLKLLVHRILYESDLSNFIKTLKDYEDYEAFKRYHSDKHLNYKEINYYKAFYGVPVDYLKNNKCCIAIIKHFKRTITEAIKEENILFSKGYTYGSFLDIKE